MMPGGSEAAWPLVKPIFQAIAAKVGPNDDIPCCEWVGPRGAGHYVKMVHNGIEYGDMQLICEAYWMLKNALGLTNDELYDVFQQWYEGELNSYLIEITRDIFSVKDPEGDGYLAQRLALFFFYCWHVLAQLRVLLSPLLVKLLGRPAHELDEAALIELK